MIYVPNSIEPFTVSNNFKSNDIDKTLSFIESNDIDYTYVTNKELLQAQILRYTNSRRERMVEKNLTRIHTKSESNAILFKTLSFAKYNGSIDKDYFLFLVIGNLDFQSLKRFTKIKWLYIIFTERRKPSNDESIELDFDESFKSLEMLEIHTTNRPTKITISSDLPNLKYLSLSSSSSEKIDFMEQEFPSVSTLILTLWGQEGNSVDNVLKCFPNLKFLHIRCDACFLNINMIYSLGLEALQLHGDIQFSNFLQLNLTHFDNLKFLILDCNIESILLDSLFRCKNLNHVLLTSTKEQCLRVFQKLEKIENILSYSGGVKRGEYFKQFTSLHGNKRFKKLYFGNKRFILDKYFEDGNIT